MKIPEKFTINSQEIKVELVDSLSDQNFGEYSGITDVIKIATHVRDDNGDLIPLKEEQIWNTFWHEVLHVFQWHNKGEYSEEESCTYSSYLIELFKTSGLKISLDGINEK